MEFVDEDITACELCGAEEVFEDHLCKDCFIERTQDRREAYMEAMS